MDFKNVINDKLHNKPFLTVLLFFALVYLIEPLYNWVSDKIFSRFKKESEYTNFEDVNEPNRTTAREGQPDGG